MTIYTIAEIAALSGMSVWTIRREIKADRLYCNTSMEYDSHDVARWLTNRKVLNMVSQKWLDTHVASAVERTTVKR